MPINTNCGKEGVNGGVMSTAGWWMRHIYRAQHNFNVKLKLTSETAEDDKVSELI